MRSSKLPPLMLVFLFTGCFALATWLEPRYQARATTRSQDLMGALMGDSQADVRQPFFREGGRLFSQRVLPDHF